MFRIADGRDSFYQWDLDRQVIVEDSSVVEVHFCNRTDACSLVTEVVNGVADVPNILLQNSFDIRVFGYDGKATRFDKVFKVNPRTRPADYVYTETEVLTWRELENRINETVAQAESTVNESVQRSEQAIAETITQAETDIDGAVAKAEKATDNANLATREAYKASANANNTAFEINNRMNAAEEKVDIAIANTNAATEAAMAAADRADASIIESVLYSMPQVLSEVEQEQARGNISAANSITCSATGTDITLTDSSNQPLQGLNVFGKSTQLTTTGKQLLDIPDGEGEKNGLKLTIKDGVYTVSGTPTTAAIYFMDSWATQDIPNEAGRTYTLEPTNSTFKPYIRYKIDGTSYTASKSYPTTGNEEFIHICYSVSGVVVGQPVKETIYPTMRLENGVYVITNDFENWEPYTGGLPSPSPEYPQEIVSVGDSGSVGVKMTGKNLFGGDALADKLVELANATKDEEAETVYVLAYQTSGDVYFNDFKPDTRYTFIFKVSVSPSGIPPFTVRYTDGTTARLTGTAVSNGTIVYTSTVGKTVEAFQGSNLAHATVYYNECGIFEGVLTADDFEPYKPIQTINIPTPNGLPGVPTASGGWVCDEIDFERGMYIKRVEKIAMPQSWAYTTSYKYPIFYAALSSGVYTDAGLSDIFARDLKYNVASTYGTYAEDNTFALRSDGQQIFARADAYKTEAEFKEAVKNGSLWIGLITPIETPLTEEELNAYRTLHTNKPNTIISNDEGAEMKVSYVADTKTYIDNKFAELATALINNN